MPESCPPSREADIHRMFAPRAPILATIVIWACLVIACATGLVWAAELWHQASFWPWGRNQVRLYSGCVSLRHVGAREGILMRSWDKNMRRPRTSSQLTVANGLWVWGFQAQRDSDTGTVFVQVPLWAPLVLSGCAVAVTWRMTRRRVRPMECPRCAYDLSGLASGSVCPECGRNPGATSPAQRSASLRAA
jgi:hypothetical protein